MDKRRKFDRPERLAVIKRTCGRRSHQEVVGFVTAKSLREGLNVALANGYRGSFSVVLESNLNEILPALDAQ